MLASKAHQTIFFRILLFLTGVFLMVHLFSKVDFPQVWLSLKKLSPLTIFGIAVTYFISRIFQGLRFHSILPAGLSIKRHIGLCLVNQTGNIFLPLRVGELFRPLLMKIWVPQLSVQSIVASSTLEKFVEAIAFLPFVYVAFGLLKNQAGFGHLDYIRYIEWGALVLLVLIVGIIFFRRQYFLEKFREFLLLKRSVLVLFYGILAWATYATSYYFLLKQWDLAFAVAIVVIFSSSISGLPAGLGVFESSYVWVAKLGGFSTEDALAGALLCHAIQISIILASGLSCLWTWGWPRSQDWKLFNAG